MHHWMVFRYCGIKTYLEQTHPHQHYNGRTFMCPWKKGQNLPLNLCALFLYLQYVDGIFLLLGVLGDVMLVKCC